MRKLSKSRVMAGLQCHKRLYLEIKRPDLVKYSEQAQRAFDIGNEVGEAARAQYPGGILVEHQDNLALALAKTREILGAPGPKTVFESTFEHGRTLIRADILSVDSGGNSLVEVKSSTDVKPQYLQDLAIQAWVIEGSGFPIRRASLAHVDTTFVYPGGGDYEGLFAIHDLTAEVTPVMEGMPKLVGKFLEMLEGPEPQVPVGPHCSKPYDCPFLSHCSPAQSEYPVDILPRGGKLIDELTAEGYVDLRDVPAERLTNEIHQRVWRVSRSGKPELLPSATGTLRSLPFPRFYLDFETIQLPVPIWAGTRPYEHLPFQWSCHIETADGRLEHREFLDTSGDAPMRAFAESLIAALGTEGPVLVYSSFERTQLNNLIKRYPDLADPLDSIVNRLIDLYPVTAAAYYHPDMKGSWSIKAVLPSIAPELDYGALGEVQDGTEAQTAYREIIRMDTPDERRGVLTRALKEYCAQDTLALVRVARYLEGRATN